MRLRRKKSSEPEGQDKPQQTEVDRVEVSNGTAKFSVAKGVARKQWIVVREIPLLDIEHVEKSGNTLNVTWKGATETFFTKEKTDVFGKFVDQVNANLEEQRKAKEAKEAQERAALRKKELLEVINSSVTMIDQSFNVLIVLGKKPINWEKLEDLADGFSANLSFTGQTMPPLNLGFSKIQADEKSQIIKEASNEAFKILKAIYGYFSGLNPEDDIGENHPNFQDAKAAISAYFMLNDLFLGEVVGDKENTEEMGELENVLMNLAGDTNFKVNIDELKNTVNDPTFDSNREDIIESARDIFKDQLKQKLKPAPSTKIHLIPKNQSALEAFPETKAAVESAEPLSKEEVAAEAVVKERIAAKPVSEVAVVSESASKGEVVAEPVAKEATVAAPVSETKVSIEPAAKTGKKEKAIAVSKVEISDNTAKFFSTKGLFGKQSVVVKEIPLLEIEHIEKFGNEISVSWKGVVYKFFSKEKTDVFRPMVDQVNKILEGKSGEPFAPTKDATATASDAESAEPQADTKQDTQAPVSEPEPSSAPDKGSFQG